MKFEVTVPIGNNQAEAFKRALKQRIRSMGFEESTVARKPVKLMIEMDWNGDMPTLIDEIQSWLTDYAGTHVKVVQL